MKRRFGRGLLTAVTAAAVGVTLACGTAVAGPNSSAGTSSFRLFDNTSFNDAHLVSHYGLTPSAVVYDSWNISCANTTAYSCTLPSKSVYQDKIRYLTDTVPKTSPLVLDFEGIDYAGWTAAEQAANDFQAWQTLVSWTREVIPASQPLGVYGWDMTWNATEVGYTAQLHKQGLTMFAPTLYTRSSDPAAWTTTLQQSITNDRAAAPDQPIYPYIWPQQDIGGQPNTYMDAATWTNELNFLKANVPGAIVWSGPYDLGSASCGWIGATREFMSGLTGRQADTGTLTAALQNPGACALTRGRTTQVPVTFTNAAQTTSAPTLLSGSAAPGITVVPAQPRIPALAPGVTWKTTLAVHVAPDAKLGDTTLTLHPGTGAQHTTAVVEDPDLAQGKPATQSSTNGTDIASLAADGNIDSNPGDGSVSETNADAGAWLQVDLGSQRHIGAVAAYRGYNTPAIKDYYLIVSDKPGARAPSTPTTPDTWVQTQPGTWVFRVFYESFRYPYSRWPGATGPAAMPWSIDVPVGHTGRYVTFQRSDTGVLALAELEVRPGAPITAP